MNNKKENISKNYFEYNAWQNNFYVCGIDEVGRGCLAGPLVVGAVVLPLNTKYKLLKDSKILTKQEREEAFKWITKNCYHTITFSNHRKIDKYNIYQTTLKTMQKALIQIFKIIPFAKTKIQYVVIDAMPVVLNKVLCHNNLKFKSFPKGETISSSIAAASIVAKVTRDNLIKKIGYSFPQFDLDQHKGYGTKKHIQKIFNLGNSIIHRGSFLSKIYEEKSDKKEQQSIF